MKLFEPLNVAGMVIPNRVMVPAMVTRLSGEDGFVNKDITDRYVRYAEGGAGLIVVEAMAVHQSRSGPLLRISNDQYVPGLSELVRRIHQTSDSKVVPQIIHFLKVAKSVWRQTVDLDEIKAFLLNRNIAKFKFPERVAVVEQFPISAAGKILRRELRKIAAGETAHA